MLAVARTLVHRDLLLALRRRSDVGTALLFSVIVASLFPLGVGPSEPAAQHRPRRDLGRGCFLDAFRWVLFAAATPTHEQMLLGAAPLAWWRWRRLSLNWLKPGLPLRRARAARAAVRPRARTLRRTGSLLLARRLSLIGASRRADWLRGGESARAARARSVKSPSSWAPAASEWRARPRADGGSCCWARCRVAAAFSPRDRRRIAHLYGMTHA
jgi:heme exporter protein B